MVRIAVVSSISPKGKSPILDLGPTQRHRLFTAVADSDYFMIQSPGRGKEILRDGQKKHPTSEEAGHYRENDNCLGFIEHTRKKDYADYRNKKIKGRKAKRKDSIKLCTSHAKAITPLGEFCNVKT